MSPRTARLPTETGAQPGSWSLIEISSAAIPRRYVPPAVFDLVDLVQDRAKSDHGFDLLPNVALYFRPASRAEATRPTSPIALPPAVTAAPIIAVTDGGHAIRSWP
jgi:hypothetical protein